MAKWSESVSVVIATYNRPDTLLVAITSALAQTHPVEEVIVVGDCCNETTADALAGLNDSRVKYINLPVRCGEQAIPNAIGVLWATSTWVAFLNHDDIWLPQHVGTLLGEMRRTRSRWAIGAGTFSYESESTADGLRPIFSDVTPPNRRISNAFVFSLMYLEPTSSWLVRRDDLISVGNWRPAWTMRRTPTNEFALRLWRRIGEPVFVSSVTCLKILDKPEEGPRYARVSGAHAFIAERLSNSVANAWGNLGTLEAGQTRHRTAPITALWLDLPQTGLLAKLTSWFIRRPRLVASIYKCARVDVVELLLALRGVACGSTLTQLLTERTNEIRLGRFGVREVARMTKIRDHV